MQYCSTYYCSLCVGENLEHYILEVDAKGFGHAAQKLREVVERVFQQDIHIITISALPLL